jgi:hypothetical protein
MKTLLVQTMEAQWVSGYNPVNLDDLLLGHHQAMAFSNKSSNSNVQPVRNIIGIMMAKIFSAHGPWNGPLPTGPTSAHPSSSGGWSRSFPSSLSSTPEPSINSSFANSYGPMLPGSGLPHEMGTQFNQPLEQLGQSMSAVGRGQGNG